MSETGRELRVHATTVITGGVLLVLLVVAGVGLAFAGWEPGAIIGLLTGLVGVGSVALPMLDRAVTLDRKQDQQTLRLAQITEQTNGGLDRRIESAVDSALSNRFGPLTKDSGSGSLAA